MSGADGTGSASKISCSEQPFSVMEDMLSGLMRAKKDRAKSCRGIKQKAGQVYESKE